MDTTAVTGRPLQFLRCRSERLHPLTRSSVVSTVSACPVLLALLCVAGSLAVPWQRLSHLPRKQNTRSTGLEQSQAGSLKAKLAAES